MTTGASTAGEFEDHWYVRMPDGQVLMMTLDEIDTAFNEGRVGADAYIVEVGGDDWRTLAEVAGLDDEEEDELTPVGSLPGLATVEALQRPGVAPMALVAQPVHHAQVQPAPPALQPAPVNQPAALYPPASAAPPGVYRAVTVAPVAAVNAKPLGADGPRFAAALPSQPPNSITPLVADLSIPDPAGWDDMDFAPKKSATRFLVPGGIFLAVVGGIVALGTLSGGEAPAPTAQAARPEEQLIEMKPRELPPLEKEDAVDPVKDAAEAKARFSDAAKASLLKADEERATKAKSQRSAVSAARPRSGKAKEGHLKGSTHAYDPLNGAL